MTKKEIKNKVKEFEQNCGYALKQWERDFAYFWYEQGSCYGFEGEPDLCSEYVADFRNLY